MRYLKELRKFSQKRLQIIRNKNLKIIYNLPRRFSTKELHRISGQKTINANKRLDSDVL